MRRVGVALSTAILLCGLAVPMPSEPASPAATPRPHTAPTEVVWRWASEVSAAPVVTTTTTEDYDHRFDRVAMCESGGWRVLGAAYPDSLGINAYNWHAFGGGSDLSPAAQVAVAERLLAANGLAGWVPDANGCAPW